VGLVEAIANAIATAEGFFVEGSIPANRNNPGDLRSAPWLQNAAVVGGFWNATSIAAGIAGLHHQIALDIARGMSLKELIYAWAPPSDGNETAHYLNETVRRIAVQGLVINFNTPLWNYLTLKKVP